MYLVVFLIIIFYQLGISREILVGAYRPSAGSGASGREGWGAFLGDTAPILPGEEVIFLK
jgi:hypothetical protein